jgi:hypothetical protein
LSSESASPMWSFLLYRTSYLVEFGINSSNTPCISLTQETAQEAAQEAERIKQDATADSRKARKEERYRATMARMGKLPPCPKIVRGEECSRISCEEEERGFDYKHLDNMVVCQDRAHSTVANKDGCLLFHLWRARKNRSPKLPAGPPAKNLGGEPWARGKPPRTAATRGRGSHVMQERGLSSSSSSSLEGCSGSSSKATSPTKGRSRS